MKNEPLKHRRNLFEVDNARNLSMKELVRTFIPTQSFWRLLSAKHHVLLGARGQGKTALAKMLSHDHLALMAQTREEPLARSAVRNQEFIGMYLPTRLEWVGGLNNKPWMIEGEREELLQWRLNVASCIAFIPIARSCISIYVNGKVKQAQKERELAHQLSKDWLHDPGLRFDNLLQFRCHLEDIDYRKSIQVVRERARGGVSNNEMPEGLAFGTELLVPLRQGIRQISRLLSLNPHCAWLLCIDEAEFLEESYHRILNSHMRAYPENLFLKITTMPYCHYTLATNIGADLVNGQDFEYLNMDKDDVMNARVKGDMDTIGTWFGRTLFEKLIKASPAQVTESRSREIPNVKDLLGSSEILDPRRKDWKPKSDSMKMLEKYASPETVKRAHKLIGTRKFRDEIGRKMHGALLLRKEVDELRGNMSLKAYSGARMAIRCADGNPRRLIRIFNALLMKLTIKQKSLLAKRLKVTPISRKEQTRALQALSAATLNQIRSFPDVGPELHEFIRMIGEYMHANIHEKPLTTDQVTSIVIDNTISEPDWKLIQMAVGQGLLYPNIGSGNTDEMPWKEGTFHLGYALAPRFLLLPRRGTSVKLSTIMRYHQMTQKEKKSSVEHGHEQLFLFDKGTPS